MLIIRFGLTSGEANVMKCRNAPGKSCHDLLTKTPSPDCSGNPFLRIRLKRNGRQILKKDCNEKQDPSSK
jgi:hypothetical protein